MGQLEFGPSHDFFFSPSERDCYTPPPARWKCGNPASLFFAGFPSPVERVENSFLAFGVSHAFHGASFPPRLPSPCARWCFVSRVHLPLFFALGQKLNFSHQNLAPGSPRCDGLAAPRPKGSPL